MTRAQRSYHAFIRDVRAAKGITYKQAIGTYRALKVRLDRPVRAVDIGRHPRMLADAIKSAKRHGMKTVPQGALDRVGKGGAAGRAARRRGEIDYDEYEDYDYEEYVWTFDTGKKGK